MREIIACFPVYRTYVNDRDPVPNDRDRQYIERAVREAKRRNPNRPAAVYHFVRDLLLKRGEFIPESERGEHMQFVGKFQQVTSPVTAKGIEDTALYLLQPAGVAERGRVGDPIVSGRRPAQLHQLAPERPERWPHGAVGHVDARHQAQRRRAGAASTCCRKSRARGSRRRRDGRASNRRGADLNRRAVVPEPQRGVSALPDADRLLAARADATADDPRLSASASRRTCSRRCARRRCSPAGSIPARSTSRRCAHSSRRSWRPTTTAFLDDFRAVPRSASRELGVYNSLAQVADEDRRARACPTSTRAPSCGTSASSIPTTAGPSTTRRAAACSRSSTRTCQARGRAASPPG